MPELSPPTADRLTKKIRKKIEATRDKIKIPRMTVGRAIGFASAIYEFATHNDQIDVSSIESRLRKKTGMATGMQKSKLTHY